MAAQKSDAVHNEQLKLAATAFNNVAVAFVVTGGVIPTVSIAYQTGGPHGQYWFAFLALWLAFGYGHHYIGRKILEGLRS